jgi:LysM repeat protein
MTLRRWSGLATAALLLCGAAAANAADTPPRSLHKVGDHWTAWNPPAETPAGAQVYTVVAGDTLWGLASRFLKNGYLWPQIWEQNKWVEDAHWIYPGDPLVISVQAAAVEDLAEQDMGGTAEPAATTPAPESPMAGVNASVAPLQPLGTEDDIYCSGYVGELEEQFGYHLVGSEYGSMSPRLSGAATHRTVHGIFGDNTTVKYNLSLGDIVYIDGGAAAGLSPGLTYVLVAPRELVHHPESGEVLGRLYAYEGRVRVLTAQDNIAIAEIVQACDAIHVGDGLKQFVPEPVPLGRRNGVRPANMPVAAEKLDGAPVILRAKDDVVSLGEDHVVFINVANASPGDMYTIYRAPRPGFPPMVLGELAVLSVHAHASLARILESRYPIYIGDKLEPK